VQEHVKTFVEYSLNFFAACVLLSDLTPIWFHSQEKAMEAIWYQAEEWDTRRAVWAPVRELPSRMVRSELQQQLSELNLQAPGRQFRFRHVEAA
jgi:hypothetical protein